MLVRGDDLVIGQPAHAWISGQLARAWGSAAFGTPVPREAVCLAAEQHDIGWHDRDLAPSPGPDGRPLAFTALPRAEHLALWAEAPRRLLAQSRYAALLVSLHGTSLYARVDPGEHPGIAPFLARQRALQTELGVGLDPAEVDRNRRLLRTWDRFSLALCLPYLAMVMDDVPTAGGTTEITLGRGRGIRRGHAMAVRVGAGGGRVRGAAAAGAVLRRGRAGRGARGRAVGRAALDARALAYGHSAQLGSTKRNRSPARQASSAACGAPRRRTRSSTPSGGRPPSAVREAGTSTGESASTRYGAAARSPNSTTFSVPGSAALGTIAPAAPCARSRSASR